MYLTEIAVKVAISIRSLKDMTRSGVMAIISRQLLSFKTPNYCVTG